MVELAAQSVSKDLAFYILNVARIRGCLLPDWTHYMAYRVPRLRFIATGQIFFEHCGTFEMTIRHIVVLVLGGKTGTGSANHGIREGANNEISKDKKRF